MTNISEHVTLVQLMEYLGNVNHAITHLLFKYSSMLSYIALVAVIILILTKADAKLLKQQLLNYFKKSDIFRWFYIKM